MPQNQALKRRDRHAITVKIQTTIEINGVKRREKKDQLTSLKTVLAKITMVQKN